MPLLSKDLWNGESAGKKGGTGNWSPDHRTPSCDFTQIYCQSLFFCQLHTLHTDVTVQTCYHSPTAVTHPCLLLNTPLLAAISHWKHVPSLTSGLVTLRVDTVIPNCPMTSAWGKKGGIGIVGAIVRFDIVASPVTSQLGRNTVLLYWQVTMNAVGGRSFLQNGTSWGSVLLYPTWRERSVMEWKKVQAL